MDIFAGVTLILFGSALCLILYVAMIAFFSRSGHTGD